MPRVLVATGKPGWFVDAADPEGKKVRKQEDDQVFDNLLEAQEARMVLERAHGPQHTNGHAAEEPEPEEEAPVATQAKPKPKSKPKASRPETVEIRCAWIEGGKNDGTPYETVKLVSGKTIKGLTPAQQKKACGERRLVKTQDLFQVRYCAEHQEENRKQLRREKARGRTAKRQAAKAKA